MSISDGSSKRVAVVVGGLSVLVLGGVTTAVFLFRGSRADASTQIAAQIAPESLRQMVNTDQGEKLLALYQSDRMTEEMREQMERNMREVMESEMNRRIDEYYSAAEADREAILDKHIDEFVARQPKWMETMRKLRESERDKDKDKEADKDKDKERRENRRGAGWAQRAMSKDGQQRRVEGRSAERMMKMGAYFMAAHARATARGIQMPMMGGGHGRGGPGGGPGGAGGPRGGGGGDRKP